MMISIYTPIYLYTTTTTTLLKTVPFLTLF